ncbi:ribonuclease H-like domain-containing protein [Lactarius akahatsu]|uniref:Ribonuclease H-like domain-containing protein n=1 Tax=Lactarius akahatsu TaxID=416441 RepID=A0AAD4L961_9AGAM|nr:ribonuclease H-like domain-containing protein [Lactarius akahatsu]
MLLNLAPTVGGSRSTKGKGEACVWNEVNFLGHFGSLIVGPMDRLFECADISLNQFSGRQEPVIKHAPDLPKPQLEFKRKFDNTNGNLWSPTLCHKFNTRVPLGYAVDIASIGEGPDLYRYEINNLPNLARMFRPQPPIPLKPFDETPLTQVSTHAQLAALVDKLRENRKIAIDLEYRSYRPYSGFVCLMQISTRDEDWIVDPFELHDELRRPE